MGWQRVGLVPDTDHNDAQHLHRSALVISRKASDLGDRYGRAALGTLEQDAAHHRLAMVGAVVVWGKDEKAVGAAMMQHQAAMSVVVLRAKPKKDGPVLTSAKRLAAQGAQVEVYTIPAKAKTVRAIDVGTGRKLKPVLDLRRPPQQQHAPSTPRPKAMERKHTAPSTPRSSTRRGE